MNMTFLEKEDKDRSIFENVINYRKFLYAKIVLTYVSTKLEVDTINIMKHCLKNNKKLAVPICSKKDFSMDFYYISSLEELHISAFSLLEPKLITKNLVSGEDIKKSICLVPGLAYSLSGHRIGYGCGFYDRFFSRFSCFKLGLCYNFNIEKNVLDTSLDVCVDAIATEGGIINISKDI